MSMLGPRTMTSAQTAMKTIMKLAKSLSIQTIQDIDAEFYIVDELIAAASGEVFTDDYAEHFHCGWGS